MTAERGDAARVTVTVAVPPDVAFAAFTERIDVWWRRGRRYRNAPNDRGIIRIEPGAGGRLFESIDTDGGERVIEIGRTLVWDPPHRLVLEWRNVTFAPHEHTEVEIEFHPSRGGTTVVLVHRGWGEISRDHPVRHGLDDAAFMRTIGLWWGDQLTSWRLRAAAPQAPPTTR